MQRELCLTKIGRKRNPKNIQSFLKNGDLFVLSSTSFISRKHGVSFFHFFFFFLCVSYKARHSRYIQPHEILHPLYFSCIRPELRRQGLIGQLFNKSLEIASDYHFDTVVCESSTTSTAIACGQLGFREVRDKKSNETVPKRFL